MATTDASIGYGAVPDTHPQPRPRASKAVFGAAVLCCLVTIALVPPVNKSVLRGSGGIRGHPLSMTSVQLLGAAVDCCAETKLALPRRAVEPKLMLSRRASSQS